MANIYSITRDNDPSLIKFKILPLDILQKKKKKEDKRKYINIKN